MAYGLGKHYCRTIVRDWYMKVLNDRNGKNLYGRSVYAIFKETGKAIFAMVADGDDYIVSWIPKACTDRVTRNYARWDTYEGDITVEEAIKAWKIDTKKQGV